MWIVAVSVRVVCWPPYGFRTCPTEVTYQFVVPTSNHPLAVAVPPSRLKTYGLQVLPSEGAVEGLGGGPEQSLGWFDPCGWRTSAAYGVGECDRKRDAALQPDAGS